MDLTEQLTSLEDWMRRHTPLAYAALQPPLTEEVLADEQRLARSLGFELPAEVLALYRWRGGSSGYFLGLNWQELGTSTPDELPDFAASHPVGHIQTSFSPRGHFHFLHDSGGNFVSIDLAPAENGVPGQIITAGRDETRRFVLAATLTDFLAEYVHRLQAGAYVILPPADSSESERVCLLDGAGQPAEDYRYLAELFPGFGSAPTVPLEE